MVVVTTKSLNKIYQGVVPINALADVNLTFEKGEFSAIVGPSGSGKTTLLNILGGLDKPTSGEVWIDGVNVAELDGNKLIDFRLHNIGFVFQNYNLIPVLTAKENVDFVMLLQNIPVQERESRTHELLEAIGLGDRKNNRPSQLSGGQQQRVAVARALAPRPRFILADEPTANLDAKSATNLLEIMNELNRVEQMTFIFSTHDPRVIERARRVITLDDGRVISDLTKSA